MRAPFLLNCIKRHALCGLYNQARGDLSMQALVIVYHFVETHHHQFWLVCHHFIPPTQSFNAFLCILLLVWKIYDIVSNSFDIQLICYILICNIYIYIYIYMYIIPLILLYLSNSITDPTGIMFFLQQTETTQALEEGWYHRRCFRVPRHSGHRWNLSTLINNLQGTTH